MKLSIWRFRDRGRGVAQARALLLALQGGGAHGAYTWGVLDAWLERGHGHLGGLSGASAGALNAAVLAHGLWQGGQAPHGSGAAQPLGAKARQSARDALERFWRAVAAESPFERHAAWLVQGQSHAPELTPLARWMLAWTTGFTPEQLNPMQRHPLRDVLQGQLDLEGLRTVSPVPLFIAATRVRDGAAKVFREQQLCLDVLLASTCLPRLQHTVVIDGEAYWDGGFSANPPLLPLLRDTHSATSSVRDLLLVTLQTSHSHEPPATAAGIQQRQLELGFGASLQQEWAWLEAWQREAPPRTPRWLPWAAAHRSPAWLDVHLHRLGLEGVPAEAKLIATDAHFTALRDAGYRAGVQWLANSQMP